MTQEERVNLYLSSSHICIVNSDRSVLFVSAKEEYTDMAKHIYTKLPYRFNILNVNTQIKHQAVDLDNQMSKLMDEGIRWWPRTRSA